MYDIVIQLVSKAKQLRSRCGSFTGFSCAWLCIVMQNGQRTFQGGCGLATIVTPENEFCQNLMSKDTITTVDSGVYDSIGGHKHSLDQDTYQYSFKVSVTGSASLLTFSISLNFDSRNPL